MNGEEDWEQAPGQPDHLAPLGGARAPARYRWRTTAILATIAGCSVAAGATGGVSAVAWWNLTTAAPSIASTGPGGGTASLADLVASVRDSVVSIDVIPDAGTGSPVTGPDPTGSGTRGTGGSTLTGGSCGSTPTGGTGGSTLTASTGSGVVVSYGVILTNNHLLYAVRDSGEILVRFSDGRTAAATVLARKPESDLALLRADSVFGLDAATATLGDSDALRVGDNVIAIGNALGLPGSVSAGVVSALHRRVTVTNLPQATGTAGTCPAQITYPDAIQTDAEVNPGNSGGPLFDATGRVVGITSVVGSLGTSDGSIGVGFAIPVNEARAFIEANLR